jgi:hypothetical protein
MSGKAGLIERGFKLKRPKWTRLWDFPSTTVLQRWWWQAVAPGLMWENRNWQRMYERTVEERNKLEDRVEELKEERFKQENYYNFIHEGYWRITPTCSYRIDKKFIEWYSTWIEPVQMELEFEYKGLPTEEEIPLDRKAV